MYIFLLQPNLGPLKGELTPVNTMKSTLGGSTIKGSSLGPLRGSLGDSMIQTTNTGPRLSNEGFMRSSAEAYLRRSTDVNICYDFYLISVHDGLIKKPIIISAMIVQSSPHIVQVAIAQIQI